MPDETEIAERPTAFRDALKAASDRDPNNPRKPDAAPEAPPEKPAAPATPPPAAPAAPAAPAEPEGILPDDNERAEGKKPTKGTDFRRVKTYAEKMKQEAEGAKSKLSEYEKELAELRKRPAANADEIQKVLAERDQYKSQFEVVALEVMPEFQAKYSRRLESVGNSLKEVLPPDVFSKVSTLLNLPESDYKRRQLTELVEELDPISAGEVAAANREIRGIMAERQQELANSQTKLGEIVETRKKAHQEHQAKLEKLFESEAEKAMAEDPLYKLKEGDSKEVAEWNDSVKEARQVAKAMFNGGLQPQEMAHNFLKVARHHVLVGELKASRSRISELEGVVKKLQGGSPDVEGSGGQGSSGAPEKSFREILAEAANRR